MRITILMLCSIFLTSTAFADTASLKGQASFISDAPAEKINGTASGSAELTMKEGEAETIRGEILFDVASMETGNKMRNKHLRSSMWLDLARFPKIKFKIEAVTKSDDKTYKVKGDFTLHGVTKSLTALAGIQQVTAEVPGKGLKKHIKVNTEFNIALADYKIEGKKGVIGDKVGKEIEIKVALRGFVK